MIAAVMDERDKLAEALQVIS